MRYRLPKDVVEESSFREYLASLKDSKRKALEDTNFNVFVHTNRNRAGKVFSVHPVKSCGKSSPLNSYPKSVLLEDIQTYFETTQRKRIMKSVFKRFDDCENFEGIARTVYGGICGKMIDVNFDDLAVQDFIKIFQDEGCKVRMAIFPPTFPNESKYEEFLATGCSDPEMKEFFYNHYWGYSNKVEDYRGSVSDMDFLEWAYVDVEPKDARYPNRKTIESGQAPLIPFSRGDFFIFGGFFPNDVPQTIPFKFQNDKGQYFYNWISWVVNPR